jgi:hypothetical protein
MKIETYARFLAQKLAKAFKNGGLLKLMFPSRQLVPVRIKRQTSEFRRRHSRF